MNATDAGQVNSYFVNHMPVPAQGYWTFWKQPVLSANNPPTSVNTLTVAGVNVVQNYYALCVGDFNRSYAPSLGLKSSYGSSSIHLLYDEPLLAGPEQEVSLPIQVTNSLEVGAIAMIIDFPSAYVTVEDVVLGNGDMSSWAPLEFSAIGNELRIGWFDQMAYDLDASDCLVTLKLRTTAKFTGGHTIRFSMQENELNELADAMFEPVGKVELLTRDIAASATGIGEQEPVIGLTLDSYPNPFANITTINYTLPEDGEVTLEVANVYGSRVAVLVDETQTHGQYSIKFHRGYLNPGVYAVTLKQQVNGTIHSRTIKIICSMY